MNYTTALLQLLRLTLAIPLFSTLLQAQSADVPRNLFGVELIGRGIIYSVNYERLLTDRIGAGGGISVLSVSGAGIFGPSHRSRTLIVPAYLSWTPVGRAHSPYLAAGVTLSATTADEFLLGNTRVNSGAFGTFTVGYQYRSQRGIVIRPNVSQILIDGDNFWWPGITLGVSF